MRGFGGGNFLSSPGSLEGSFNAGRQNMENRGRYRSDMLTANLERMLKQAEEQRTQETHPLDMQNKQLTNEGLGLGNQKSVQDQAFAVDEQGRKQQKHDADMDAETSKVYGDLAAELEMLPAGARMQHVNRRLGNSRQGRDIARALEMALKQQQITLDELPQGFSQLAQARAKLRPEHIQAVETSKIAADQRLASTEATAAARIAAANMAADSRVTAAEASGATRAELARISAERAAETLRKKQEHDMNKLQRQHELKVQYEKEKAKMDAGGEVNPRTFEALSVKFELQARNESDPEKRAELQQAADDALQRSLAKSAAGKQQSDVKLDMSGDKPAFKEESRTPPVPPRGGASGGWGPIKRIN